MFIKTKENRENYNNLKMHQNNAKSIFAVKTNDNDMIKILTTKIENCQHKNFLHSLIVSKKFNKDKKVFRDKKAES